VVDRWVNAALGLLLPLLILCPKRPLPPVLLVLEPHDVPKPTALPPDRCVAHLLLLLDCCCHARTPRVSAVAASVGIAAAAAGLQLLQPLLLLLSSGIAHLLDPACSSNCCSALLFSLLAAPAAALHCSCRPPNATCCCCWGATPGGCRCRGAVLAAAVPALCVLLVQPVRCVAPEVIDATDAAVRGLRGTGSEAITC
jgi:hypothetical protein